MFSNERYLTREVADRVPVEIQILMWDLVEEMEGEKCRIKNENITIFYKINFK